MAVPAVLRGFLLIFVAVFSLWPFYIDIRLQENVGLNPQRIILLLAVVFFLVSFFLTRRFSGFLARFWRENYRVMNLMLMYGVFRLIAAALAGSYSILTVLNELIGNLFLMFIASLVFRTPESFRRLALYVTVCATAVSVFAIVERLMEYNFLAQFADVSTKAGFTAASEKIRDEVFRVQATFEHPLSLVQYLAMAVPLLYVFHRRLSVFIFPLVGLMGGALWFTGSRSALVALFLSAVAIVILWAHSRYRAQSRRRGKRQFFSALVVLYSFVVIGGGGLIVSGMIGGESESQSASSATRLVQLNNGFIAIAQKPLFGHGPGEGSRVIMGVGESQSGGETVYVETTDNLFLSIAVESGLPALIVYLLMIFRVLKMSSHGVLGAARREGREVNTAIFASLIAGVTLMAVLSIFTILPLFFILMGAAVGLYEPQAVGSDRKFVPRFDR